MPTIEARCCVCGSQEFGGASDNNNSYSYSVPGDVSESQLTHGAGSEYGTERLPCPACSGSCDRFDDCEFEDPCEQCETFTLHNRCGGSVPTANV